MRRDRKTLTSAGITAVFMLLLMGYLPAMADQPHMHDALSALQRAKSELEQATRDKGGHRDNALIRVNEAIIEVKEGIEYDRTHIKPGEVNLNDLRDMRAENLDPEMKVRGFRYQGGYRQHESFFTTWWNPATNQCVSIETKYGRVHQIEEIFQGNCK